MWVRGTHRTSCEGIKDPFSNFLFSDSLSLLFVREMDTILYGWTVDKSPDSTLLCCYNVLRSHFVHGNGARPSVTSYWWQGNGSPHTLNQPLLMLPAEQESASLGSLLLPCGGVINQITHSVSADSAPVGEESAFPSFLLSTSGGHDTRFPVSSSSRIGASPDHPALLAREKKKACPCLLKPCHCHYCWVRKCHPGLCATTK